MEGPTPAPRNLGPFVLRPIGVVRSPYARRYGTPQQASSIDSGAEARIELDPAIVPAVALADLVGIDRIWVIAHLDRGGTFAAEVTPPRGPRMKRSLFATRSPDRPNPIGLSAVSLVRIEGTTLHVRGIDLLDGTPVLDLKPYLPYADCFPDAKAGWVDTIPRDELQRPKERPEPRD